EGLLNFKNRFPYFQDLEKLYRVIRFRVQSQLIDLDANVGPDDLFDLQSIYLSNEDAVCFILGIWQVPPDQLQPPRYVDIPV
ncbi:MAG: hypothetical protein P1V19_08395, partial [Gimesia sp.]|nr:hypothetical protein [Gimesia sp.]